MERLSRSPRPGQPGVVGPQGSVAAPSGYRLPSPAAPWVLRPAPSWQGLCSGLQLYALSRPALPLMLCCSRTFSRSLVPWKLCGQSHPHREAHSVDKDSFRCSCLDSRLPWTAGRPLLFSGPFCRNRFCSRISRFPAFDFLCSHHWGPVPGVPGVLPTLCFTPRLARPSPLFLHRSLPDCLSPGSLLIPSRGCPASAPVTPGHDLEPPALDHRLQPAPVSGPARGPQGCVNRLWTCPYLGNSGKIPSQNLGNAENAKIPRVGCFLL